MQSTTSQNLKTPVDINDNNVNYDNATEEQQQAGNDTKEDAVNTDNTPSASNIAITAANQQGEILIVRTTITGLDDDGTCTLVLSNTGSDDITIIAGTQTLGSYSVCKGFDVPVATISKGTWKLKITYSGQGKNSVAVRDVLIN